jgi:hypothetical protein
MENLDVQNGSIVIGNKTIPTEIREIDIFDLHYYAENPRINFILSKCGGVVDEKIIEDSLWKLDSTKELANDIKINGGLLEEIIVVNNEVVEGNSRLCAYRHLYKNSVPEQQETWHKIRSKVILTEISTEDLFQLLGKLHIKGKTQWDPYEKASYISKMINENHIDMGEVARIVGSSISSIKTALKAYELMRDTYLPKVNILSDEKTELKKFSIFEEYYKSNELQSIVEEKPEIINNDIFVEWVLEGRINSAAYDVKKDLANILKSKTARKVFIESDPADAVDAAKEEVYIDRPENADPFIKRIKDMTDYLEGQEPIKIKESVQESPRKAQILRRFHSTVNNFYRNTGIQDPNKEFITKQGRSHR